MSPPHSSLDTASVTNIQSAVYVAQKPAAPSAVAAESLTVEDYNGNFKFAPIKVRTEARFETNASKH
jgi:hypothetical protein